MPDCKVCMTPDSDKPMCFRGEEWCCDDHRKLWVGRNSVSRHSFDNPGDKGLMTQILDAKKATQELLDRANQIEPGRD